MIYSFLSSPVKGLVDIRKAVHDLELPDNRGIWVDELDDFRTSDELDREDTFGDTLEGLFRRIRESQEFLILLGSDWYGTGLRIDDQIAHVSYWEAELFYAILLGRKVRVFEVAGFQPNGKLEILLGMLRNAIPSVDWEGPYERSKIVNKIHEYLIKKIDQSVGQQKAIRRLRANLVDGFFNLRGADAKGGLAENESLPFFDGAFLDSTVIPNEIVISKLLNDARSQSDEEGRLTKLWVVFRELSSASSSKIDRREFLNYWNRFYGEWASAGSWYGLHGHPNLAVLPALVQQAKTRNQMQILGHSAWKDEEMAYPGGALASSRYSIAGISRSLITRRFLLGAALKDIERSISEGAGDGANLLATRGSIYRRLGAIWAAVKDYEYVLQARQRKGASDGAVGQAMSELGFGYLYQLRFWKGRSLLEEGVQLLSTSDSRLGFLIQAKRKLSVAYFLTGHPKMARDILFEAQSLAKKHNVLDQIR